VTPDLEPDDTAQLTAFQRDILTVIAAHHTESGVSFATDGSGPMCGALGCTDVADVMIRHPKHGDLIVCEGCTGGYVVIGHV